MSVKIWYFIRR